MDDALLACARNILDILFIHLAILDIKARYVDRYIILQLREHIFSGMVLHLRVLQDHAKLIFVRLRTIFSHALIDRLIHNLVLNLTEFDSIFLIRVNQILSLLLGASSLASS